MGRSPLWVRHRLAKAGVRSISNVVDVTNYVMLELGHPLHAFDADSIVGGRLVVKRAVDGEELETLDGETRALTGEDLIIYDDEGPTSMSGTIGGARSEVSAGTTNVLMEAASWDPPTIMYMSRRHGLRSEASTRFERGVDPNLADEANRRAAAMVVELAGGSVPEESLDVIGTPTEPVTISLAMSEVSRLLGPGFSPRPRGRHPAAPGDGYRRRRPDPGGSAHVSPRRHQARGPRRGNRPDPRLRQVRVNGAHRSGRRPDAQNRNGFACFDRHWPVSGPNRPSRSRSSAKRT